MNDKEQLMVWDAYKCHINEETRKELNYWKMHGPIVVVPNSYRILKLSLEFNLQLKC